MEVIKEKNMEDRDTSSESDSDEDKMSKAKSIKSKMPLGGLGSWMV